MEDLGEDFAAAVVRESRDRESGIVMLFLDSRLPILEAKRFPPP